MKKIIAEDYAVYNEDCMNLLSTLGDESIDFSVYSPPFAGLYNYSSDSRDFSNCKDKEEFLIQYEYFVKEKARVTKSGRITAVHCTDIMSSVVSNHLWDFPHEIIKIHEKYGFEYKNRITIWKEPLKVRMRTMVQSLMHKFIVEDATNCFTAMPDYVLIFKKRGENKVPVRHDHGLRYYFGSTPVLDNMIIAYNRKNGTTYTKTQMWEHLKEKYRTWDDPKTNKLSHYIWQRYASSVWDDIRIDNVLSYKEGKDEDDEKHVHPLQLDVYDRLIYLYTNENEVVLEPFAGVMSGIYSAVSLGRKAVGSELKTSYFKQGEKNMKNVKYRFGRQKNINI